uniref:Uncharacterized protein n=1 Tax=Sipha flava TaxID=143950 RepID=A0A2S2R584_9HEMI
MVQVPRAGSSASDGVGKPPGNRLDRRVSDDRRTDPHTRRTKETGPDKNTTANPARTTRASCSAHVRRHCSTHRSVRSGTARDRQLRGAFVTAFKVVGRGGGNCGEREREPVVCTPHVVCPLHNTTQSSAKKTSQ